MYDEMTCSIDTEIALLLCVPGSKEDDFGSPKILGPSEFNRVYAWVKSLGLGLPGLLMPDIRSQLPPKLVTGLTPERLELLLSRKSEFGELLGSWHERGIWFISVADSIFPDRLASRLGKATPPILFGVGDKSLLGQGGLAVVGSRDADSESLDFAEGVGSACAQQGIVVVSGGARGVDARAMLAAVEGGGQAVGILAESLLKQAEVDEHRSYLERRKLTLVTPYRPDAGFTVGTAMARNKHIYALADWSLVVSATAGSGGTWSGAMENLRQRWSLLFVRDGDHIPEGNRLLIRTGAVGLTLEGTDFQGFLAKMTESESTPRKLDAEGQTDLFGAPDNGLT